MAKYFRITVDAGVQRFVIFCKRPQSQAFGFERQAVGKLMLVLAHV